MVMGYRNVALLGKFVIILKSVIHDFIIISHFIVFNIRFLLLVFFVFTYLLLLFIMNLLNFKTLETVKG